MESARRERWTEAEAEAWWAAQPWPVGANFVPSTAINQLEMWQADSYDEATIDLELAWAAELGFNTMRVFLHDLLWTEEPEAFLDRIDRFLAVAEGHGISLMFVMFDGVWNPFPVAGTQPEPIGHVHNYQWVQGPGAEILGDLERHDELEPYVKGVIGRFRTDPRVLAWDLFNEPDNPNIVSYSSVELPASVKEPASVELLRKAFDWARSVGSTFQDVLPIFDQEDVGAYNWGLVSGRTQTIYSWGSWFTMDAADADPWFHDVPHPDGTPYDTEETDLIRQLTGR